MIEAKGLIRYCFLLFVALIVNGPERATGQANETASAGSSQGMSFSYGATWETSGGYSTTLVLNNGGSTAAIAQVALYSTTGQKVGSSQVRIDSNDSTRLVLSSLVSNSTSIAAGGLSVQSTKDVSAQVLMSDSMGSTVSYSIQSGYLYDTENMLSAPWWLPDAGSDGVIKVFNTSAQSITVFPSITVDGVEKSLASLSVATNSSEKLDLRALLKDAKTEEANVGSLTLHYIGAAHALQPSLFLSNTHTGFALMPNFNASHAQLVPQQTIWLFPYVGMALEDGVSTGSAGAVTAYALLSNGTKKQVVPQVTAYAVGDGEVQQGILTMPSLGPQETRLVNLSQLVPQISPQTTRMGLTFSHAGQPGDLGIAIFTVNSGNQVVALSRGLILPTTETGLSYWDVSSGRLLLHHIKSATRDGGSATATLYYQTQSGLASYSLPTTLTAKLDQEKTINLAQIIRNNIPDSHGTILPPGVNSGIIVLSPTSAEPATVATSDLATCSTPCNAQSRPASSPINSPVAFVQSNTAKPLCTPPPSTTCPTGFNAPTNQPESLESIFAKGYRTGVGSVFSFIATGSGDHNGVVISEALSLASTTCSSSVKSALASLCVATQGLKIDAAGKDAVGNTLPATSNVMYDEHSGILTHSVLSAGGATCTITCNQTYSCNGTSLGNYEVNFTISSGTYAGSTITNIAATETKVSGNASSAENVKEQNMRADNTIGPNKFSAGSLKSISEELTKNGIGLSTDSLREALRNPEPPIRSLAAAQLASNGEVDNAIFISNALSIEHDSLAKTNLATSLAVLDPIAAHPVLTRMCVDIRLPDYSRLAAARFEINLYGDQDCSATIQKIAISSSDVGTRQGALLLLPKLIQLGESKAEVSKVLKRALTDAMPAVRMTGAEEAIEVLGSSARPLILHAMSVERDPVVKSAMVRAISSL